MKVIFDNDAASDDVTALMYLAIQPNITIEGITIAGTGEAHGANGAATIADVCYLLGKPNIPIAYGSENPCDSHGKPFPDFIRRMADDLLIGKNVPKHPCPTISNSAIQLIKTIIETSNEKITLLATGPLTNIAEFIQSYPQLKEKIEKIVIMGGAVKVKGNIQALEPQSTNTVAEWNIYADPKAAEIVFSSNVPVTLVALDATNQVPMTKTFYDTLSQQQHPVLKLFFQTLKDVVDNFDMNLFLNEFYLWDTLAAMICCHPELALTENLSITMDLETAQTKCVDKGTANSSTINVANKILNPQLILQRLIDEIKYNLINKPNRTLSSVFFKISDEIKQLTTQEPIDSFKHFSHHSG